MDRALIALQWLCWVISLRWLELRVFEQNMLDLTARHAMTKIGHVHEMHAHARVVWLVAARRNLRRYTIQQAALPPGKRYFFAHREEIQAGLALPDVFHVFEERV